VNWRDSFSDFSIGRPASEICERLFWIGELFWSACDLLERNSQELTDVHCVREQPALDLIHDYPKQHIGAS